jgi:hypothetical protein
LSSFTENFEEIEKRDKTFYWKALAEGSKLAFHIISGFGWSQFVLNMLNQNSANYFREDLQRWDEEFS